MILGTILESKATRTSFGLEYVVSFDDNPEACSQSGCYGPALAKFGELYCIRDRVVLQYRSNHNSGLWYIVRKVGQCI